MLDPKKWAADLPDVAPATPDQKKAISVRIDTDVLAFFRAGGRGYQTRMNAVLRAYMEASQKEVQADD